MLLLLVLLLQWRVTTCTSSPTLEDNMLPTDEEIADLINSYHGQPEQEIALNLPTDEEAFNEIKPILQAGSPFYYFGDGSGHFISSSFPEIDSRGFHESVFDNFNDFYPPVHRGKKYDSSVSVSARGFYGDVFTDGFGSFHPVKRFYKNSAAQSIPARDLYLSSRSNRKKRSVFKEDTGDKATAVSSKLCATNCTSEAKSSRQDDRENDNFWRIFVDQSQYNQSSGETRRSKRSPSRFDEKYNSDFWKEYADMFEPSLKTRYYKRKPASIHEDAFRSGFGDFETLRKRRPESDGDGLERGVFNEFGSFNTLKKRVPEISSSGFHGDVFNGGFGNFETLKKRVPEGFHHGDVFSGGFGSFETLRKRVPESVNGDAFNRDFGQFTPLKRPDYKTRHNFNGDNVFDQDFGYFDTVKRKPDYDVDRFLSEISKRKMSSELDADTFHKSFGDFEPLKKRKPLSSINEDSFHRQFGDFETLRKRRKLEDISGDAFHSSFGNFNTMKRKPDVFTGDAFHGSFGSFATLKKRVPEIKSSGFHEDVFTNGFGNVDLTKRTQRQIQDYQIFKNILNHYTQSETKPYNHTDSLRFNVHSNSTLDN
ncbi:uncharacterized protein LOC135832332 isoform X2 [Planococcus citri]